MSLSMSGTNRSITSAAAAIPTSVETIEQAREAMKAASMTSACAEKVIGFLKTSTQKDDGVLLAGLARGEKVISDKCTNYFIAMKAATALASNSNFDVETSTLLRRGATDTATGATMGVAGMVAGCAAGGLAVRVSKNELAAEGVISKFFAEKHTNGTNVSAIKEAFYRGLDASNYKARELLMKGLSDTSDSSGMEPTVAKNVASGLGHTLHPETKKSLQHVQAAEELLRNEVQYAGKQGHVSDSVATIMLELLVTYRAETTGALLQNLAANTTHGLNHIARRFLERRA